jgi:uncharacterized protein (DUF849 family)
MNQVHFSVNSANRSWAEERRMRTGHARVWLKDGSWIGADKLAESHAVQVGKPRHTIEGLGLKVATPAEESAILSIKDGEHVAF